MNLELNPSDRMKERHGTAAHLSPRATALEEGMVVLLGPTARRLRGRLGAAAKDGVERDPHLSYKNQHSKANCSSTNPSKSNISTPRMSTIAKIKKLRMSRWIIFYAIKKAMFSTKSHKFPMKIKLYGLKIDLKSMLKRIKWIKKINSKLKEIRTQTK